MSSFLPSARSAMLRASRSGMRGLASSFQPQLRTYAASSKPSTSNKSSAPQNKPAASSSSKLGTTSAADLHPLPDSVKSAAKPSGSGDAPKYDQHGNSVSAADMSSRPAAPGPSAPKTSASKAAPGLTDGNRKFSSVSEATPSSEPSSTSPIPQLDSNWASSFAGMSSVPFPAEVAEKLERPINQEDIEIKPDGLLYLPEIKYRRILTQAFGPGGWGLAPRSETNVGEKIVSREWALVCLGRFVSTARGEQEYFDQNGVATASEGAKSNALMRCCKDLGIAHELWDPRFIRNFKQRSCVEVFVENSSTGRKRKLWRRKDAPPFEYPWKESK